MNKVSENIIVGLIYMTFFSLIGFAIWRLESAWPLVALILAPAMRGNCDCEDEEGES
jgi:hypothetical protein